MYKVIGFILFYMLFSVNTYSQVTILKVDSLSIERLKKKLPQLKGAARVDCLNDIAREYLYIRTDNPEFLHAPYYYSHLAYREAVKIGYQYGQAFALIAIGAHMPKTTAAEKYFQQAISIGEILHNDKILGWAYLKLSNISWHIRHDLLEESTLRKKALQYFEKAGDSEGQTEAALALGGEYLWDGNFVEAFPYCEKAIIASRKKGVHNLSYRDYIKLEALSKMSKLYEEAGDYKTAMDKLIEGQQYGKTIEMGWGMENAIGQLYDKMGMHDSAYYYLKMYVDITNGDFYSKFWLGGNYLTTKKYEEALKLFKEIESSNIGKWYPWLKLAIGQTYSGMGNYEMALPYSKTAMFSKVLPLNGINSILDGYSSLAEIYHGLGKNDSAYYYQQKYTALKDSITNTQLLWRLNEKLYRYQRASEDQKKATELALLQKDIQLKVQQLREQALLKEQKEAAFALLDKDNKLTQQQLKQEVLLKNDAAAKIALLDKDNKIKQQQLKQESLIKNFLFGGLFILLLTGFFIFRTLSLRRKNEKLSRERTENELIIQKLESDKRHTEMLQQATELEMQALRAQMSPHFIFNCLSSINKYIIKNETEAASDYLTRFSRLIRMVLINSQKQLITLEDELDMLRLYLDMERLRFNNAFDYNISFINTIEPGAIFIPPLLLQPFCENAIWHGLMHKDGHGKLDIALRIQHDILYCSITDNGVGRDKAAELKSKSAGNQKSLGLKITNDRLAILNQGSQEDSYYKMDDIIDEEGRIGGTKVDIRIRYKDLVNDVPVKEII